MESKRFDELVRVMTGDASRRGVVRAGFSALVIATSAALSLTAADEVVAKRKRRAKKTRASSREQKAGTHKKASGCGMQNGRAVRFRPLLRGGVRR